MTSRPILFSAPMVRAILEGRKTQTRRVVNPQWDGDDNPYFHDGVWKQDCRDEPFSADWRECKYGESGDELWVREACWIAPPNFCDREHCTATDYDGNRRLVSYDADMRCEGRRAARDYGVKRRPPMFMPRWASRLTLEITDIRVERLQDISEADAKAEGFASVAEFRAYWDTIYVDHPWAENPWLWVISFRRVSE